MKGNFCIRIKEKQLACIIPKALLPFSHLRNMLTAAPSLSLWKTNLFSWEKGHITKGGVKLPGVKMCWCPPAFKDFCSILKETLTNMGVSRENKYHRYHFNFCAFLDRCLKICLSPPGGGRGKASLIRQLIFCHASRECQGLAIPGSLGPRRYCCDGT